MSGLIYISYLGFRRLDTVSFLYVWFSLVDLPAMGGVVQRIHLRHAFSQRSCAAWLFHLEVLIEPPE